MASRGLVVGACVTVGFCAVLSATPIVFHSVRLHRLENSFALETRQITQHHEELVQTESKVRNEKLAQKDSEFQVMLRNPRLISGELAAERHAQEWSRRLAHEPAFAKTEVESALLQMEKLGHDANVTAQTALERVAAMAAPPGSRVEVSKQAQGFIVRVAFRMSALSRQEKGAVTKHHTTDAMRHEIQGLCSRVIRDLFDYCGSRGIQKISVSCNHALQRAAIVPLNATSAERAELLARAPVVMGNLYRARIDRKAAQAIADWRKTSARTIQALMDTEYDGLKTLTINSNLSNSSSGKDPEGALEF
jgi:hypothetical protein